MRAIIRYATGKAAVIAFNCSEKKVSKDLLLFVKLRLKIAD
jgi:hypothetical protein